MTAGAGSSGDISALATALGGGDEFDLVRAIAAALGPRATGLGDDAAVVRLPHGDDCVVSVDAAVEGVHFRRGWLTPREIGYRAAAAAMSDLAAMAAEPRALLLAMTVPADWRSDVAALADGVGELASSVGARVVGGNLSAGTALSLTITVIGSALAPLRRSGLHAGDLLYVTGRLGGPAAALAAFETGAEPAAGMRARFAHPVPRIREAQWLAAHGAVAAIDVSDGLVADAGHLAAASGVRIELDAGRVPRLAGVPETLALRGGEEYELLVGMRTPVDTMTFAARFAVPLTHVGRVVAGEASEAGEVGVVLRGGAADGVAGPPGHDHFSG